MDSPTPTEQLAAARTRVARLRAEGAAAAVLARYEHEVRRLEEWIAHGVPIPPASVPFAKLDPLTQRALIHQLVQDTKDDPDPEGPSHLTDEPATVSLEWPAIPTLDRLVDMLARNLIPPLGPERPPLEHALAVVVNDPPLGIDAKRWTHFRARRFFALVGLAEAMLAAEQRWTRRIGSHSGSAQVTGIPARAGAVGYLKWLQQEAPEYARLALREWGAEIAYPEHDESGSLLDMEDPAKKEAQPDRTLTVLAQALLIANEKQRRMLMAQWHPEHVGAMEEAAELARDTLTPEDRRLLEIPCRSDAEIAVAADIPERQVPMNRRRLRNKLPA